MQREAIAVVQPTKSDLNRGIPITDVAERVIGSIRAREGVQRASIRAIDPHWHVALLDITVERPAVLKRLAGDGITAVHQKMDERMIAESARMHGPIIATSLRCWTDAQRTAAPATNAHA